MKIHPWPLGIIVAFIIFCSFMIAFAVYSKSQPVELVSKDYYQKELLYQEDIDEINRTIEEGLLPKLELLGDRMQVSIPEIGQIESGKIQLYRPDDPGADRHFQMKQAVTAIPVGELKAGRWEVRIRFQYQGKWYQHQQTWVK